MRTIAIAVLLFLAVVGCGPQPASMFDGFPDGGSSVGGGTAQGPQLLKVKLTNEYAESIFTVSLSTPADGGVLTTVLDAVRVPAYESREANFGAPLGAVLGVDVQAVSLGRQHGFSGVTDPVNTQKRTLLIVYDYDIALARFRARYGWASP